jgi:hypothetical protein
MNNAINASGRNTDNSREDYESVATFDGNESHLDNIDSKTKVIT